MNQKHLLRYIKKTLKSDGDIPVIKVEHPKSIDKRFLSQAGTGTMTLKQVFESMNLTPYDLTIDMLDCHAVGWIELMEFLLAADSAVTNPVFEIQAISINFQ